MCAAGQYADRFCRVRKSEHHDGVSARIQSLARHSPTGWQARGAIIRRQNDRGTCALAGRRSARNSNRLRSGGGHGWRGAQAGDGAVNGGASIASIFQPGRRPRRSGHAPTCVGPLSARLAVDCHQQARFQLRLGARQFGAVNGLAGGADLIGKAGSIRRFGPGRCRRRCQNRRR